MNLLTLRFFLFSQDREATWHGVGIVFFWFSVLRIVGDVKNICLLAEGCRGPRSPVQSLAGILLNKLLSTRGEGHFFFLLISETSKGLYTMFTIGLLLFLFLLFSFVFLLLIIVKYISKIQQRYFCQTSDLTISK